MPQLLHFSYYLYALEIRTTRLFLCIAHPIAVTFFDAFILRTSVDLLFIM